MLKSSKDEDGFVREQTRSVYLFTHFSSWPPVTRSKWKTTGNTWNLPSPIWVFRPPLNTSCFQKNLYLLKIFSFPFRSTAGNDYSSSRASHWPASNLALESSSYPWISAHMPSTPRDWLAVCWVHPLSPSWAPRNLLKIGLIQQATFKDYTGICSKKHPGFMQ